MNVRQLRHFIAVAETLHFGRAAERLGMSQPPLSQSIQALEREVGTALFLRTKRNVALTIVGEQWLPFVRRVLEDFEDLPISARRLRDGDAGRLQLSFVSTADYSLLPGLVRRYVARYPDVDVQLVEATSDVQLEELAAGRGDAGIIIGPLEGVASDILAFEELLIEPLVAAVPEAWAADGRIVAGRGRLTARDLGDFPLILFPRRVAPSFHDAVIAYFSGNAETPRIAQQAIQMQTIVSLVSAEMGVALVPSSLRNLPRPGVRYVALAPKEAPMLSTGIVWRRSDPSPTLARFREVASALRNSRVEPTG